VIEPPPPEAKRYFLLVDRIVTVEVEPNLNAAGLDSLVIEA
jgi:hypothetical protein